MDNLDVNKVLDAVNNAEVIANPLDSVVTQIVETFTMDLDDIMKDISTKIIEVDDSPLPLIEKYFLKLSNAIYFLGIKIEELGLRDDISEAVYKEVYNNEFLTQSNIGDKKPTAAALTAMAENKSIYESTANSIFNRAYKMVKIKLDAADSMRNTLSKILSRHIQEMQLTGYLNDEGKTILNE